MIYCLLDSTRLLVIQYTFLLQICLLSTTSSAKVSIGPSRNSKVLDQQTSFSSSSANTTASASNASTASSSPPHSPGYEELKAETSKMHYLTVRKLSDDEFSEADSMTR